MNGMINSGLSNGSGDNIRSRLEGKLPLLHDVRHFSCKAIKEEKSAPKEGAKIHVCPRCKKGYCLAETGKTLSRFPAFGDSKTCREGTSFLGGEGQKMLR